MRAVPSPWRQRSHRRARRFNDSANPYANLVPVTYSALCSIRFVISHLYPLGNTPLAWWCRRQKVTRTCGFRRCCEGKRGAMSYSSGGVGSITHLAMEAFRLAAGWARSMCRSGELRALTGSRDADFYFAAYCRLPFLRTESYRRWLSAVNDVPHSAECADGRRGGLRRGHIQFLGRLVHRRKPRHPHRAHYQRPPRRCGSDAEGRFVDWDSIHAARSTFAKLIRTNSS